MVVGALLVVDSDLLVLVRALLVLVSASRVSKSEKCASRFTCNKFQKLSSESKENSARA